MNDNELRNYFHQNRPQVSQGDQFIAELSARMEAVAQIKRIHDASIRRYRWICAVTFISGCLIGMAAIAFVLLRPVSAPQFQTAILASLTSFIIEWKAVFIPSIAIVALTLGLAPWKRGFTSSPVK